MEGRPCRLRLRIEDGPIQDLQAMGFHLMESPDILVPIQREYETEDYPEQDGVKIYPYTTYRAFEYTVKLLYLGLLEDANIQIRALHASMFESQSDKNIRKAREVFLYNDFKGVMIAGYMQDYTGKDFLIEVDRGAFIFELTIFCADPHKCNFEL